MRKSQHLSIALLSFLGLFQGACRQTDNGSQLKHAFENTSRLDHPLQDCKSNLDKLNPGQTIPDPNYALAEDYVRSLAEHIIKMNPNTFKGYLAPEHFCYNVIRKDEKNAYAWFSSGNVVVYDSFFSVTHNDAGLAGVLAHELAHVAMDHANDRHPILMADGAYQDLLAREKLFIKDNPLQAQQDLLNAQIVSFLQDPKLASIRDDVVQIVTLLSDSMHTQFRKPETPSIQIYIESYKKSILAQFKGVPLEIQGKEFLAILDKFFQVALELEKAEIEAGIDIWAAEERALGPDHEKILKNWREQEADEVGYELYLRAGFKAELFRITLQTKTQAEDPIGYAACLASLDRIKNGLGATLDRGKLDHPSECWRNYDIQILETDKHKQDYAALLPNATLVDIFPGELAKVKASLPAAAVPVETTVPAKTP